MGLGPKLLSYRAASGKGGFFKGTLSGPFSSSPADGEGSDAAKASKSAQKEEAKKSTGIWSWGKKEEKQVVVEEKIKEPEGVEVRSCLQQALVARGHSTAVSRQAMDRPSSRSP